MEHSTLALDSDEWEMARLQAGFADALQVLFERYHRHISDFLFRIIKDRNMADDLEVETFAKVYRYRAHFRFEAKFSTWLYVIAKHLAFSALRRKKHNPVFVSLEDSEAQVSGEIARIKDATPPPDKFLETQETGFALDDAILHLPTPLRTILVMFAYDGCSQEEIATKLHCSRKAVEMRLYHGRQRLLELFDKDLLRS